MKKVNLMMLLVVMFFTIQAQVTVKIGDVSGAEPGSVIRVPVTVSGMNSGSGGVSVSAVQLAISYNNAYLTYDSTLNFNSLLPASQWFFGSTGSKYTTNWIEPNLLALDIPDNTVLFEISFLYTGGTTQLDFELQSCEILDASYDVIQNVQYQGGLITPSQGSVGSVWTGEGDWNTVSNWSNGIPGDLTIARIQSGTVSVMSNATCKSLEIGSGTGIHVYPGGTLTVDSLLTNSGSFFIHSDASGTGSVIFRGDISGTGNISIEDYLLAGNDHLISPPVSGYSAGSQPGFIFGSYSEPSADWTALSSGTALNPGTGYRAGTSGTNTLVFSGKPRYQSLMMENISFAGQTDKFKGLNLIGNPFTSALRWNEGNWERNHIDGAIYVWNGYKYLCWNGTVGSLNDGIIPSMQGFFVKADAQVNSLIIPEAARMHSTVQQYKESALVDRMVSIRLENISDPEHYDEAFLQLADGTSKEYDNEFDAYKYFGSELYPEIYTLTPEGSELAINVKSGQESVPVVCRVSAPGTYRVSFNNINSFPADQQLSFEDKAEGTSINLRTTNNLIFISDGTTEPSRFMFHFYLVGEKEVQKMPLRLWNDAYSLYFADDESDLKSFSVDILSITGANLLHSEGMTVPGKMDISSLNPGLYIICIKSGKGNLTRKLLVTSK